MTWFNASQYTAGENEHLLAQSPGSGSGTSWLAVRNDGHLMTQVGGSNLVGETSVPTGEWHHIALSYDGETLNLYLDAQLEASEVITLTANDGDFVIGTDAGTSQYFDGLLDELVIVNHLLSAEQLYDLVNPVSTTINELKVRYRHASGSVWPGLDPDGLALYLPLDRDDPADLSLSSHQVSCTTHCPTTEQPPSPPLPEAPRERGRG